MAERQQTSNIVVTKAEIEQNLRNQIAEGRNLIKLTIRSEEALKKADAKEYKWSMRNRELLKRFFDDESIVKEYNLHYFMVGDWD